MGSTGYSACGQHGSSAIHSEIKGNQWLIPERSGTIMAFRSYGRCTFWAPGILKWTVTPSVFLFPIIGPFLWKSGPYNSSMGPPSSESVCVFIHSHTASFAALTYWRRKFTLSNCDAFGDHEVNWVRLLSESLTGKASLPDWPAGLHLPLLWSSVWTHHFCYQCFHNPCPRLALNLRGKDWAVLRYLLWNLEQIHSLCSWADLQSLQPGSCPGAIFFLQTGPNLKVSLYLLFLD